MSAHPFINTNSFQIIVIGGGLAGLTAAIDLRLRGFEVLLIEKKEYPFHKVCGEYVSNEVKPYLERLGAFPAELQPKEISRFEISTASGKSTGCTMAMGGFGISRFAFDNFLFERAKDLGVNFLLNSTVAEVSFAPQQHIVKLSTGEHFSAGIVIGAFGKRSLLDKNLDRTFFKQKSFYVGIKHHFRAEFPDDLVALHNFEGGYCGLSRVEGDAVNLCFLTTLDTFKKYKNILELEQQHLSRNPHLKEFFGSARPLFDPLVISQVSFSSKKAVENHVLMCGDAAGLIHPLCGNGMAMAIHGAKICAGLVDGFFQKKINRQTLENTYTRHWQRAFRARLFFGKQMERLFTQDRFMEMAVSTGRAMPTLVRGVVKLSHGKMLS